jgi:hypothetical protein
MVEKRRLTGSHSCSDDDEHAPALALLVVIDREPEIVRRALH